MLSASSLEKEIPGRVLAEWFFILVFNRKQGSNLHI
jgi:hypothetical protein